VTRLVRLLLGALGVGAAAYGAVQLLDLGTDNLRAVATWLVGGVLLHDAVLAPLTIAAWYAASRTLGPRLSAPLVVGAVVLGSVTLVGVPVLGRHLARPYNPTLLDRPYLLGWGVLAALTCAGVLLAELRRWRRRGDRGSSARR
jgi:hypothetical protein